MTNPTVAQSWLGYMQHPDILDRIKWLRRISAHAVVQVDNYDKGEYQFHFADDSILIVNQHTGESRVHSEEIK